MRSAVTVTLVPESKAGPFVFSEGLQDAFSRAAEMGFDAVEIFPRSSADLDGPTVTPLADRHGLRVAAVGTGAGWVVRQLSLTHADVWVRGEAREFVRGIIGAASTWGAPAIIGSMQGRWVDAVGRERALGYLAEALEDLGAEAERRGVVLLYEPLNRYETNLFNRVGECTAWLRSLRTRNVRILADLFHMNIEETDTCAALREAGPLVGHVHFADSNRRAVGMGQIRMHPIISTLKEIGYAGYLSAEILPLPDAMSAARQTLAAFRQYTTAV